MRAAGTWHERRRGAKGFVLLACVASLVLAACGGSTNATRGKATGKAQKGGTATYAMSPGNSFTWMLPLQNSVNDELWDENIEFDMWRPLYFAGEGTDPVIDEGYSLAYPPVWSDGNRTVTIRLKHLRWSDGRAITTRDVRFFFDLYDANKSLIGSYLPGDMPDNVSSIDYPSATTFVMHLDRPFSQQWYEGNELTKIVPMPQHLWDREAASGPVGNYDMTRAGAVKVLAFLYSQSKQLATYSTNPLWKVVDGPFVIESYDPTTARTELGVNKSYPGPDRPRLAHLVIETFASDTAEVDALRSGEVDFGFLPYSDYSLVSYFKSHGFQVAPWVADNVNYAELSYTSPVYGPLVRQLYIREALQHVVDEPLYLRTTLHGLGQLTYGPVPNLPDSPYVSPQEKTDPDPYSTSDAKSLLEDNGWAIGPDHYMVCKKPGTGPGECGAGIAKGRTLDLLLMYTTGYPTLQAQVGAYQTAAAAAGIEISLDPQSETTQISLTGVCPPGPCNWGIAWYSYYFWDYGQTDVYPTGGQLFGKGNYWGGGYYSPEAQHLIELTHTKTGLSYLFSYENYISRQVAALWVPTWDYNITVASDHIGGWLPQEAFGDELPQRWYLTS
ncbi:MAG: ABC transporter substrate-binding protein [Acidimicrobiales bacterium]